MFDNGNHRSPPYTRVVQLAFDPDAGTIDELWEWRETPDFFDAFVGDADRLPNGNTLITSGARARLIEVTPEGEVVWSQQAPREDGWIIYRAEYLAPEQVPGWVRPFD